ncbi:uncharacterized protein LACBIDRAFT_297882 [Laccaria bicolor S238N-H82]|uniref:Predicted protein n=1 Tax=Laccaria bicolor (strain S238N-H82 / ATCC MYA-4686) TaxID=486041 RepID=B0DB40_LACBS|nr:uncharacterized protein LACBIDRAFT_297882 [Laccaria bicolor S238N-H82]EDR08134.1 predicted protein [Laccaria bicolor S238N-H82]|eukprot:XP_001881204.1 predicted protein [Laccaria bicolor S238N-H82]
MDEEPIEFLVARRSRRSTAGNRMEAALAEMALDDADKDLEDDKEFVDDKEEQDVFGSDFESTDEEAEQQGVDAGETMIQEEEQRARRTARSRVEKATAIAHERQKATFNPQAEASASVIKHKAKVRSQRQVSLRDATDTADGETVEHDSKNVPTGKKRKSKRKHTILSTSAAVARQKESEQRKAAAPKKIKNITRTLTQAELIARALDNEEGNIVEHRDYLKVEEEKRKRARVVRATVHGPLLRWVSKVEEIEVVEEAPAPVPTFAGTASSIYGTGLAPYQGLPWIASTSTTNAMASAAPPQFPGSPFPAWPPFPSFPQSTPLLAPPTLPTQPATLPEPRKRTEKVAKNYLIHELAQYTDAPKATWNDTMKAMFGDHVKWDELKVYTTKGRPLSRPIQSCPITGKPAIYFDPRTGVPFADVAAFDVLTRLLAHEYVWSPELGCYTGKEEPPPEQEEVGDADRVRKTRSTVMIAEGED